ncbi:hypothetical protein D3C81_2093890 [compost metagenome]
MLLVPVDMEDECRRGKIEYRRPEEQIQHQPVMQLIQEQKLDRGGNHTQREEDEQMAIDDRLSCGLYMLIDLLLQIVVILPPHRDNKHKS